MAIVYARDKDLKEKFIVESENTNAATTVVAIKTVLKNIDKIEREINKSCYELNKSELIQAIKDMGVKTKSSVWTYASLVLKYISFVESTGIEIDKEVYEITISDFEDLIKQQEEKYITRQELFDFIAVLKNPQDKMLFVLLYEGVMGDKYDYLRLLKESDINLETGEIKLPNKVVKVTDKVSLAIIKAGLETKEYWNLSRIGEWNMFEINPANEYVIKKVRSKKDNLALDPMLDNRIKNKIREIGQITNRRELTGMVIYQSGLAERVRKHYADKKVSNITHADIEAYCKQYFERGKAFDIKRVCQAIYGEKN